MPAPQRGQVLMRVAALLEDREPEVATDLTREEGKTLNEAIGEVRRSISILRFFGSEGWQIGGQTFPSASRDVLIYSRREPMGLVLAITPWNFPIAIPSWKIAPALVAGNAVILKPAQLTPGTATHLVRALADAGMPPGVLSLVLGTGSMIGNRLIDDPRVSALSFTGSLAVGSQIYERAARRRIRTQLEMGGKNAIVVLDDADPVVAARIAAAGAFGLTGQACTATSRVICQRGVAPALEAALEAESRRFLPGDGLEAGVLMGPVVSEDQLEVDRSFLDAARSDGLRIVAGEEAPRGLLHPPAIISGVKVTDRLAQEEIFGPVVSLIEVASLD
jgi:aldehyde dehydrogenase (NAD+)